MQYAATLAFALATVSGALSVDAYGQGHMGAFLFFLYAAVSAGIGFVALLLLGRDDE